MLPQLYFQVCYFFICVRKISLKSTVWKCSSFSKQTELGKRYLELLLLSYLCIQCKHIIKYSLLPLNLLGECHRGIRECWCKKWLHHLRMVFHSLKSNTMIWQQWTSGWSNQVLLVRRSESAAEESWHWWSQKVRRGVFNLVQWEQRSCQERPSVWGGVILVQ